MRRRGSDGSGLGRLLGGDAPLGTTIKENVMNVNGTHRAVLLVAALTPMACASVDLNEEEALTETDEITQAFSAASCAVADADHTDSFYFEPHTTIKNYNTCYKSYVVDWVWATDERMAIAPVGVNPTNQYDCEHLALHVYKYWRTRTKVPGGGSVVGPWTVEGDRVSASGEWLTYPSGSAHCLLPSYFGDRTHFEERYAATLRLNGVTQKMQFYSLPNGPL